MNEEKMVKKGCKELEKLDKSMFKFSGPPTTFDDLFDMLRHHPGSLPTTVTKCMGDPFDALVGSYKIIDKKGFDIPIFGKHTIGARREGGDCGRCVYRFDGMQMSKSLIKTYLKNLIKKDKKNAT